MDADRPWTWLRVRDGIEDYQWSLDLGKGGLPNDEVLRLIRKAKWSKQQKKDL